MRALLPDLLDVVDLHTHYASDWVEQGGIRANMIASLDGAAAADGLSAGLQTGGDNAVFAALRDLADVVLVGSSTAQMERYRPVKVTADHLAHRAQHCLGSELPVAVVTRSLKIDLAAPLFGDPGHRPFVITCGSSDAGARAALDGRAELLICGDDDIDYAAVRRELAARGLSRVLCEGGPTILSQVLLAGELDELCLSVSPLALGPGAGRIVAGEPWPGVARDLALHSVLEEDGALFLRYVRG